MDNTNLENFETFPRGNAEEIAKKNSEEWKSAMSDAPGFAGEDFGDSVGQEGENSAEYNESVSDAAALLNYGIDAAARKVGVSATVEAIKNLDTNNLKEGESPVAYIYRQLGIETNEQMQEIQNTAEASEAEINEFREGPNAPTDEKSEEGLYVAIDNMKELIAEVEGADPVFNELRNGARRAEENIFEYAVKSYGVEGLSGLFEVLASQKESQGEVLEQEDDAEKNGEVAPEGGMEAENGSMAPESDAEAEGEGSEQESSIEEEGDAKSESENVEPGNDVKSADDNTKTEVYGDLKVPESENKNKPYGAYETQN